MKDQELGSNASQVEGKIHAQGLLDKSLQEDAEPKTERIDCEGAHKRVLQIEY